MKAKRRVILLAVHVCMFVCSSVAFKLVPIVMYELSIDYMYSSQWKSGYSFDLTRPIISTII